MYSRPHKHSEPPLQLPEHYSGCAFSAMEEPVEQMPEPVSVAPPPPVEVAPREHQEPLKKDAASLFAGPLSLLGGLHFEELLLIGLIFLLMHSDQGSDLILWLALLLFYK